MRNTTSRLYKNCFHRHKITQNNTPLFGSSVRTVREQMRNRTGMLVDVAFKWPLWLWLFPLKSHWCCIWKRLINIECYIPRSRSALSADSSISGVRVVLAGKQSPRPRRNVIPLSSVTSRVTELLNTYKRKRHALSKRRFLQLGKA